MCASCLVDDPPAYQAPKRTPPRLDFRLAEPRLNQDYVVKVNDTVPFRVPVVSEDAGDRLFAILLLDYAGGPALAATMPQSLPASTADDTSRVVLFNYPVPPLPSGCHSFTVRVTHEANVDLSRYPELIDASDSAEAYWRVNVVNPVTTDPPVKCPTASGGTE